VKKAVITVKAKEMVKKLPKRRGTQWNSRKFDGIWKSLEIGAVQKKSSESFEELTETL
jgi:hypothetical protein